MSRLRRSARRRPSTRDEGVGCASLSAADDDEVWLSSQAQSTAQAEGTSTALMSVDVTGATFVRQCAYLQSRTPTSLLPGIVVDCDNDHHSIQFIGVVRCRAPSSRSPSAVSSDYGFALPAGVVRRVPSMRQTAESVDTTANRHRATSETRDYRRRRQEITSASSTSAAAGQQSRGRTTVRQLKRKNDRRAATLLTAAAGGDSSALCSWRHSLCAGFKSSKCDAEDQWVESRPDATPSRVPSTWSSVMVSVEPTKPARSQSLPRSFRASFIAPLRRLLSSRSLSSTTTDGDAAERPSSRRLVRAASDSGGWRLTSREPPPAATTTTSSRGELDRRCRSLERASTSHAQQRSVSRTASLNRRGAGSSEVNMTSSPGARQVHVNVPSRPCTRPPATVRLRPRRADDVDRYQSSSGHWSADSESAGQRDSWNPAISDDKTAYNDNDSAVSLLTNSANQLPVETTLAFDDSEKTDSDTTVVTVVEGESTSLVDESTSVVDDEQSLFSVDQDGFFTSMHADSGLAVQATTLAGRSSDSTDVQSSTNVSVETKNDFHKHSPGGDSEGSDMVSVTALTMQLSSSSSLTLSGTDNEPGIGQKLGIGRLGRKGGTTFAEKGRTYFTSSLSVQPDMGAYLSFCTVTPPSSDDDEALTNQSVVDDRRKTRNVLSPSATVSTPLPPAETPNDQDTSTGASLLGYYTLPTAAQSKSVERSDDGRFSTWPCSPVPGSESSVRGILKSRSDATKCRQPQKFIKFSPGEEASYNCTALTISDELDCEVKASSTASSVSFAVDQTNGVEDPNSTVLSGNGSRDEGNDTTLLSEGAAGSDCSASKTSSATELMMSSAAVPAALILSSLVILKPTYVESTHRRLICRPVGADEWRKFSSYASRSGTLPRHVGQTYSTLGRRGSEQRRRKPDTEGSSVERRSRRDVLRADDGVSISTAQPNNACVSLPLLRSTVRNGTDGYCREKRFQPKSRPTVEDAGEPAVMMKPASSKSFSETSTVHRQQLQRALSPAQRLASSNVVLQPTTFEDKQLQKPAAKLISEDICRRKNVPVSGENVIRSVCKSSVKGQDSFVEATVIRSATAEVETTHRNGTSVDLNHTDKTRTCSNGTTDARWVDGDVKRSRLDLLPINSAAVYDGSVARSSDSISSILSAAERSRAAKLAFLGFGLSEDDQPVVEAASVGDAARLFPARSDDSSVSCSSSGLGSSVSGSPVVSPDDNTLGDVDQAAAHSKHAFCGGQVSETSEKLIQPAYKRTIQITDRSKQTSV